MEKIVIHIKTEITTNVDVKAKTQESRVQKRLYLES